MLKIDRLLMEEFDIPVEEYFNLTDRQRNKISIIITEKLLLGLLRDPYMAPYYIDTLRRQLVHAELNEDFEKADMIYRLIKRLNKKYKIK
jgi:hypothetical protein